MLSRLRKELKIKDQLELIKWYITLQELNFADNLSAKFWYFC